jgi:hypothetical protein
MRILAVTPLYPPTSRVGAWLTTHEFLAHMATRGHRISVVSLLGVHDPYTLDGVVVHPGTRVGIVDLLPAVDVVVSHCGDEGEAHRAAIAAGIPSVRMVHGIVANQAVLDGATLAVFNSESLREATAWNGRSIVAHPPVNPDSYRTTRGDCITLVNLAEAKGGQLFGLIARSMPDRQFLGVRGGYGRQIVTYAPNVNTIQPTQHMRDDVYARTRVLLMPSAQETWGRVGIEAMCSGIPVIAHPTPGLTESLGDAGIFVDRGDLAGWRRAIERLDDPDVYAQASQRALRRVAQLDHRTDLARFTIAIESLEPALV